jgi:hypothetical protein
MRGKQLIVHLDPGLSQVEGAQTLFVPNSTKGDKPPARPAPQSRGTNLSGL